MKTQEFITKLKENKGANLLFEYSKGKIAGTNYHLTEVKNVTFETVDCGGNTNNWKETHLQLWESPNEIGKENYLTVDKVIDIIERVNDINPLWLDTEVKVEFGNEIFHTSILDISGFVNKNKQFIVQLFSTKTGCKAPSTCGVEIEEEKEETACCAPTTGSGCC